MSETPQIKGRSRQKNVSEDLWDRTLSQIKTKLGRMAYLSRLRNPETDRYEHHGLVAVFGEADAEEALRRSHLEVLASTLALSVLDLKDDVRQYLEGLPQSAGRLLANWEKTKGYEALLPQSASAAERELFEGNLNLIIKHLKSELADGEQNPES